MPQSPPRERFQVSSLLVLNAQSGSGFVSGEMVKLSSPINPAKPLFGVRRFAAAAAREILNLEAELLRKQRSNS